MFTLTRDSARRGRWKRGRAERLVEAYADLILRLSYSYLRSTQDAEDICQTVLLRLLMTDPPIRDEEHERAWVIRTTANACKDVLKSARHRRVVALDAVGEVQGPATDDPAELVSDAGAEALAAVMELPDVYREAVHLHYVEGCPIREVARLTDSTEAAVAKRLSRARKMLRTRLGEDHGRADG
ncbi:RNA polymerase sigma factor [Olsenella sp. HMSC062G07]|uniref:RNA polymerase sigma factor n=1 Tax=Olsenella sp. HMSC062G07 TaxID=1739330 RepID=UPI0008A11080|nr:sigma-70 family RNA polymerase sigma factor [Olsenella sp. HMSC062G07]OFK24386.1 hypothetical protein HMPREF2826_07265 [Olsenella sp. HMSC062G07]